MMSSAMKPEVQIYFTDPDELLKKKLKEVTQVSEFQKNHRARLMAHQRKQLKKFKSVKEDFRKLLKNLKDLDSDKKKLAQENDLLKKFLVGIQRNTSHSEHTSTSQRFEKGHNRSSFNNVSPTSNVDSVLSNFINKMDGSKSHSVVQQRVSVLSPPSNGKLGVIKATPSPSKALRQLNLSSFHSNESLHKKSNRHYETPCSTPGSYKSVFATPLSAGSPMDSSPTSQSNVMQYKKDIKRMVVRPFSPDDYLPIS